VLGVGLIIENFTQETPFSFAAYARLIKGALEKQLHKRPGSKVRKLHFSLARYLAVNEFSCKLPIQVKVAGTLENSL